jgi:hypothetical protein
MVVVLAVALGPYVEQEIEKRRRARLRVIDGDAR